MSDSRFRYDSFEALCLSPVAPRLRYLNLWWCRRLRLCESVTNPGFEAFTSLTHLNVSCCAELDDEGVRCIARTPHLKHLDMSNATGVTAAGFRSLGSLGASLLTLNVNDCPGLTDDALADIACSMQRLENLDVARCPITDTGVAYIALLDATLVRLNLSRVAGLSDTGLRPLRRLSLLQALDVWCLPAEERREKTNRSCVTDGGGEFSPPASSHATFGLPHSAITDEGVATLCDSMPNLRELCLANADVTDQGLELIGRSLLLLREIVLFGCKRITQEGVKQIPPTCAVVF